MLDLIISITLGISSIIFVILIAKIYKDSGSRKMKFYKYNISYAEEVTKNDGMIKKQSIIILKLKIKRLCLIACDKGLSLFKCH